MLTQGHPQRYPTKFHMKTQLFTKLTRVLINFYKLEHTNR